MDSSREAKYEWVPQLFKGYVYSVGVMLALIGMVLLFTAWYSSLWLSVCNARLDEQGDNSIGDGFKLYHLLCGGGLGDESECSISRGAFCRIEGPGF